MATNDLRAEIADLRDEIERLGDLVESIVDEGEEALSGSLEANGSSRMQKLRDTLGNARVYGKKAIQTVQTGIEDRPFIGVAVALGIGILVGKLLLARKD